MKLKIHWFNMHLTLILAVLLMAAPGLAEQKDMGGWEADGAYNKLYQAAELDRIKCQVKKVVEVVPMKGMSPGVALIVDEGDGEEIMVHVGPKWFLGDSIGIKRGENLKIRGSWAEIDGKDVFIASKIKKGDYFFAQSSPDQKRKTILGHGPRGTGQGKGSAIENVVDDYIRRSCFLRIFSDKLKLRRFAISFIDLTIS